MDIRMVQERWSVQLQPFAIIHTFVYELFDFNAASFLCVSLSFRSISACLSQCETRTLCSFSLIFTSYNSQKTITFSEHLAYSSGTACKFSNAAVLFFRNILVYSRTTEEDRRHCKKANHNGRNRPVSCQFG